MEYRCPFCTSAKAFLLNRDSIQFGTCATRKMLKRGLIFRPNLRSRMVQGTVFFFDIGKQFLLTLTNKTNHINPHENKFKKPFQWQTRPNKSYNLPSRSKDTARPCCRMRQENASCHDLICLQTTNGAKIGTGHQDVSDYEMQIKKS